MSERRPNIHQQLCDRVDAVRNGRTWTAIAKEIGVRQPTFARIRWHDDATWGIETYNRILTWVEAEEKALADRAEFLADCHIRYGTPGMSPHLIH